ncbi:transposase [Streptosporangium algeriense]|uniref:Transposase n=1 Tax=Streptosporangium algeriense TaxID=1682748 RepID=A0ABW3DJP5_9ACTN
MLIWDNLNTHLIAGIRAFIADQDWLTVVQLLTHAPDLNPIEGIRSLMRCCFLANAALLRIDA